MIQVNDTKNFVATKEITVEDSEGNVITIATLYGGVELERSTSYNFTILNKELYLANKKAVQEQVDLFMAEIKAKREELGGLQF